MGSVSWLFLALLAAAIAVVIAAEWPRLTQRTGSLRAPRRSRARRRGHLRAVPRVDEEELSADDFAASVQRDLSRLPTIEERDSKR